jgi:pimeloyl-ACP methyl ester carboxylesterase
VRGALAALLALLLMAAGPSAKDPVKAVGPARLAVGAGMLPYWSSSDLTQPHPGITRALVIFHGLFRNAGDYYAQALETVRLGGASTDTTLVVAPQFLAEVDRVSHTLPATTLAWGTNSWSDGEPAIGPAPISSFQAIDALVQTLEDKHLFPALTTIVLAGHSAGGQMVQRYAVVGQGGEGVRYVVANPSSYVYFTAERPGPTSACPGFNAWKYGFAGNLIPYITQSPADLEKRFAARTVTYLLGTADNNPALPVLDKSCAGEAQGTDHLSRGLAYFAALKARDGANLHQRLIEIQGVAHNESRMFHSTCGLAVLLGTPGCPDAN